MIGLFYPKLDRTWLRYVIFIYDINKTLLVSGTIFLHKYQLFVICQIYNIIAVIQSKYFLSNLDSFLQVLLLMNISRVSYRRIFFFITHFLKKKK